MKTSELLAKLKALGVTLRAEGGELGLSAPKGALTPELVQAIKGKKSELLRLLSRRDTSAATPAEAIGRAPRDGASPLSFSQRRLWFLDQLEPDATVYNMPLAWTLRGTLDVARLSRAIEHVIERHEVLRTGFPATDGAPLQEVHPSRPLELVAEDVAGDTREAKRAALRGELADHARANLELATGELLFPALFRVAEDEHVLFLLVHHIVFDGWSADVFLREVGACYRALERGEEPALPPPPIQYVDFAVWQQHFLESDALARQLAYHTERLAGDLPVLDLASDRPRPSVQSYRGANLVRTLPPALATRARAFAREHGATVYMVLLAAYDALLARWSGQADVVVGTIVANRNRAETAELIGFFANTLVLRTDLSDDPPFLALLARVKDVTLGAFEHQDVPFEKLVEELAPERNLAYTPLFQTIFMVEDRAGKVGRIGDVEVELFELETKVARTDLMLTVHETEDGLELWAEYATDLFDEETVARLLRSYETLLTGALDAPGTPVEELPLLADDERRRVVDEWNETAAEIPARALHELVEAQAARTPEALALRYPTQDGESVDLTYRELDEAANRLARHLVDRGVVPATLVGLLLDRSPELVVGLLAILKTGAAYVPLDPLYPRERIAGMATDAKLAFCVTTTDLTALLPTGVHAVELDAEAAEIGRRSGEITGLGVEPDARAYVIYTSGSTGRPKGVELEHRSVVNFLTSMAAEPGLVAGETLLAVTTPSFDISVLELFGPLVTGGTVVVAPSAATSDGAALAALIEGFAPTVLQATPATWRLLLLSGWQGAPTLRAFSGGEALPRELADDLVPRVAELWNLYGPTETTIWSSVKRVGQGEPITIGRPIANTRLYVLDANREPVPIGVPGELWIGGEGVARGYLERPGLTAERFLPDPFSKATGGAGRMYRTGDLARRRPDGELECLGRVDEQVKLRGFRIELGEIEAVLGQVDGVRECVCVVREDVPGDQRLFAYLTADGDLPTDALRAAAREKLPVYMVPAAFVALDELPLTPNGKVDRGALRRRPVTPPPATARDVVEPRTDTERAVAAAWRDVLRVERVPVDANFFDLGGHSLLLAEVHGRLRSLDPALTIVELFQFPTIEALAERVDARAGDGRSDVVDGQDDKSRDLARGRQALMKRRIRR